MRRGSLTLLAPDCATLLGLLVAVIASSCAKSEPVRGSTSARVSALPSEVILRWTTSQAFWGTGRLVLKKSGEASYEFSPSTLVKGGQEKKAGPLRLNGTELEQLRSFLSDHDACELQSERRGIPDEGNGVLTVSWRGLVCSVELWGGEWTERDDARVIYERLDGLQRRVTATP